MNSDTDLSRRQMLATGAGALAAAGLAGVSRVAAQTSAPAAAASASPIETAARVRSLERCGEPDRAHADDDRNKRTALGVGRSRLLSVSIS